MRFKRLLFVVMLYIMAASTFVVFASSVVPWFQFRFSSQPATLVLQPEPIINGPEDELKLQSDRRKNGHAVLLTLESGATLASHARLTSDRLRQASVDQGIPVLYRKDGPNEVQVIGSLQELDSLWLWLILCIAFSLVATYAKKLHAKENG